MRCYPVGISSCGKELNEALFCAYAEAGISHIELSPPPYAGRRYDLTDCKTYSEKYGVKLWSYHLPFYPFETIDPSSLDKTVRMNAKNCFEEILREKSALGIDKFIVHPSGEPIPDEEREDRLLYATETLSSLADFAHECGAVIAVEDLPRTCLGNCSEEILRLIGGNDKLQVCFDTNHLLTEPIPHFIKAVGQKIITTHVSDYDFVNERHWLPGEGKTDWAALLDALEEIGYSGVWMYELGFDAPQTMPRPRALVPNDFARNASELFARQVPTKI